MRWGASKGRRWERVARLRRADPEGQGHWTALVRVPRPAARSGLFGPRGRECSHQLPPPWPRSSAAQARPRQALTPAPLLPAAMGGVQPPLQQQRWQRLQPRWLPRECPAGRAPPRRVKNSNPLSLIRPSLTSIFLPSFHLATTSRLSPSSSPTLHSESRRLRPLPRPTSTHPPALTSSLFRPL